MKKGVSIYPALDEFSSGKSRVLSCTKKKRGGAGLLVPCGTGKNGVQMVYRNVEEQMNSKR